RRESISSALGPAVIDADIAMLDIASLAQAAPERRDEVRELAGRFQAEKPDHRHRRLLRMRRERPRNRAAEQRDELAARHSITSSARASSVGGTLRPSVRAVSALITSSNLLDCTTGRSAAFAPLRIRPV